MHLFLDYIIADTFGKGIFYYFLLKPTWLTKE